MRLHESLTEEVIIEAARQQLFGTENPGFCVACGHKHEGIEPDAREYPCEQGCGNTVYGSAELLFMI